MVEKKLSRKELLKEPDEFMSTTGSVLKFVKDNPRAFWGACAIVLVLGLVAFAAHGYLQRKVTVSHELFQKAYMEFRQILAEKGPVPQEKLEKVFKQFDSIRNEYPSQTAGETALLYSAHVLYRMGDYKGALDRYTTMKSTKLVEKGLGDLIVYNLAMTRLALKEYEEARSLFDNLSNSTNSPYRREACVSMAGIYEAMGKKKEAVQAYKQYLKMFPQAPDAAFVRTRIADLTGSG